jgi:hypothetical protein
MENILALATAVTVYELSEALVPDSGIPAAVIAGMAVGNMRLHRMSELVEFKEQLTILLIGTLFILLAADVRIADVRALGWRALAIVAVLSLVVRPLEVLACTVRTGLDARQKLYLGWVAPRGIIAAAVATLFAQRLSETGIPGGVALRALVFTVIAVTVTLQGLSAGPLAGVLGLRRTANRGYVVLGANPLARYLAQQLTAAGEAVELIDHDPDDTRAAEEAGLKVIHGNGLEDRTLARSRADARTHAIAATTNEGVNLLFAKRVFAAFYGPHIVVAISPAPSGVSPDMVHELGGQILFGQPADLHTWLSRWRRSHVEIVRRVYEGPAAAARATLATDPGAVLPLLVARDGALHVVDGATRLQPGDRVDFAIATDRRDHVDRWFADGGWRELAAPAASLER